MRDERCPKSKVKDPKQWCLRKKLGKHKGYPKSEEGVQALFGIIIGFRVWSYRLTKTNIKIKRFYYALHRVLEYISMLMLCHVYFYAFLAEFNYVWIFFIDTSQVAMTTAPLHLVPLLLPSDRSTPIPGYVETCQPTMCPITLRRR